MEFLKDGKPFPAKDSRPPCAGIPTGTPGMIGITLGFHHVERDANDTPYAKTPLATFPWTSVRR